MDIVIAFENDEGGVSIINPVEGARLTGESDLDFAHRIAEKDLPPGIAGAAVISRADVPDDRAYRKAWRYADGVTIDLEAAKAVQIDRWRAERKPLLEALDMEVLKAIETGADIAALAARKQALRDVTKTDLSAVATIDDLKAVRPAALDAK